MQTRKTIGDNVFGSKSNPAPAGVWTVGADGSVLSTENVEGVSCTYAVGVSPAKVSIEFRKTNPFTMIIR